MQKTVYSERGGIALLASFEKDKSLLRLAQILQREGWKILGSSRTAAFLNENDISCRDVAVIIGPPILNHRVVTLSRELHASLLSTDSEQGELDTLGIPRIDLVYVTLYPLEEALADPATTEKEVIEKTDIGGPTLLRSAAKGRRIVLSNPSQIDELEKFLASHPSVEQHERYITILVAAAERRVADYVSASATYWESRISEQ